MKNLFKHFTVWLPIICFVCITSCAGTALAAPTHNAKASAAAFYSGKTLNIIVPYGAGGGYDKWARLLSPYMKKYLGVAKVSVLNQPGGGGLVGTDKAYTSPPNGLYIADTNAAGDVFSQMAKAPGVKFDVKKFNWIGRPDNDPHIMAVHTNGPYKSFDDLVHAGTHGHKLNAFATGAGSSDYNAALITLNAFNLDFQMVAAFSGSSAEKATFLSGNGDTLSLSASDVAMISADARPVILITNKPFNKLPNVPTVIQMAKKYKVSARNIKALHALADVMELGHAFFAPPGVPANRLAALRVAFHKCLEDPGFRASATKARLYLGYAPPQALEAMVARAVASKALFTPLLKTR